MSKTVAEILRESGMTEEQIKALDERATTALTTVLSTAQAERDAAELAHRSNQDLYDREIAPALNSWGNEKANLEAQMNYYKTLAEKAKEGGFLPQDAPFTPPTPARNAAGEFVANKNAVPGSPAVADELRREVGGAMSEAFWAMQQYSNIVGGFLPDDVVALSREAAAQRMPFKDYVAKKYDFAGKEAARKAEDQKKHDDAIRKETSDAIHKEYAERGGSNPMVRSAEASRFSEVKKAVDAGTRPDPLKMTEQQRRANTQAHIHREIAEQAV